MIEPRAGRRFTPAWATLALILGVTMLIASLSIDPPKKSELVAADPNQQQGIGAGDPTAGGGDSPPGTGPNGSVTAPGLPATSGTATKAGTTKGAAAGPAVAGKATACAAGQN